MDILRSLPGSCGRRTAALALPLLVLAAACGDGQGPTEPSTPSAPHMEVVQGDAQRGLAGYDLLQPVTVKVLDADGMPIRGVVVHFEAVSGGGSTLPTTRTVDVDGKASTSWRLGSPLGVQRLRAVVMSDTTVAADAEATALGPDEVDLMVVHGALAPLTGFVLIRPDGSGLDVLLARRWSDTLVYVPPLPEAQPGVVLFGLGNRPLQTWPTWTAGVDTVDVSLQPPVAVDVAFDVQAGTFEEQKQVMESQLAAAEKVWSDQGMGLVVGNVTYRDRTDSTREVPVSSNGLCSGLTVGDEVSVTVVTSIDAGRYDGWGCWSGHIWLSLGTPRYPRLLAHELGHTFTLVHTTTGLMYPSSPGTEVREGEIYRAHFDDQSVLNTIFGSEPPESRRPCHGATPIMPICLPEALDFSRMVAVAARNLLGPPRGGVALPAPPRLRAVDGFGR